MQAARCFRRSSLRPSPILSLHNASSRPFSESAAANPSNKTQIYISRSRDPLINLSLEHRLLQTSHPDSTVLLLYTNRPCVVVGRNQNPWLEVNHALLGSAASDVHLVRRRSGGGTVFHDEGNMNFSVICPPKSFHRDTHAEMVVRALHSLGRTTTRVNERHDIVMDVDLDVGVAAEKQQQQATKTFKISGSAYKLTRLRSLHHGTCLLRSPNLGNISTILRAPGEPFIKAQGVDSVRSPVANVGVDPAQFRDAVVQEFRRMYGGSAADVEEEYGDEVRDEVVKVQEGIEEMRAREWVYGQTPRFTLSTESTEDDPRERPALPFESKVYLEAKKGVVSKMSINDTPIESSAVVGASIWEVSDWTSRLSEAGVKADDLREVGLWLDAVLAIQPSSE